MFKAKMNVPCKRPECPLCDMGVPRQVMIPMREGNATRFLRISEEAAKRLGFIKEEEDVKTDTAP